MKQQRKYRYGDGLSYFQQNFVPKSTCGVGLRGTGNLLMPHVALAYAACRVGKCPVPRPSKRHFEKGFM